MLQVISLIVSVFSLSYFKNVLIRHNVIKSINYVLKHGNIFKKGFIVNVLGLI